jgi:hypothetical protein
VISLVIRLPCMRRLIGAYSVNQLGDWLAEIALALIVLQATHSTLAVTAVWVLGRFAPAAAGPVVAVRLAGGGARALPLLLGAEAALFAVIAGGATAMPLAALLLVVLVDGVLALAVRALLKAAVVAVTESAGLLREGNAAIGIAFASCATVGPLLAGAVIVAVGPRAALAGDALTFAFAALAVRGLAVTPDASQTRSGGQRLRAAIAHLGDHPLLRRLCMVEGLATVAFSAIIPIEVVFVTATLHGSASDAGLVLAAWGAGAVAGSTAFRVVQGIPLPSLVCAGMAVMTVSYAGMGSARNVPVAIAFSLLGGVGNGIGPFAFLSAVQERTPTRLQMEVSTVIEALHTAAPGLGFLLGGLAAWAFTPRATYWGAALCVGAVLLLAGRELVDDRSGPCLAVAAATGTARD